MRPLIHAPQYFPPPKKARGIQAGTQGAPVGFTIAPNQAVSLASVAAQVTAALPPAPTIDYGTPPEATQDQAYSLTPTFTGSGVTFAVTSGSLPAGLSLNSSTGAITGTPTAAGDSTFTVTATNAGGSASADVTLSVAGEDALVAGAGILLWLNPESDELYSADDLVTDLDKDVNNGDVLRWVPGLKPATLDYYRDSASSYPKWRTAANGVNGHPAVEYTRSQAQHAVVGTNFRTSDLFSAGDAVFAFAGSRTGASTITDINVIQDGWSESVALRMRTPANGNTTQVVFNTSPQTVLQVSSGNTAFSVVAWKHGDKIDWWLNGVKQEQVTGLGDLLGLTRTDWGFRNFGDTAYKIVRLGAGKAAGATEAAVAALATYLHGLVEGV